MKINWKLTVAAMAILTFGTGAAPQAVEHAPTAEQCRADQAVWVAKVLSDHGTDDVPMNILWEWQQEMVECRDVDTSNLDKYFDTVAAIVGMESKRELDFIKREGHLGQFMAEDAAGKR